MIKTVLFDYAGVISPTQNNYQFAIENCQRFNLSPKELMEITYKNWGEAIIGKIESNIFWDQISIKLNIGSDELMALIIKTFPLDKKMINLIKETKKEHITVLTSNQIKNWLEKVINDNNLKIAFNYFINSYNIGLKKPDQEFFYKVLEITSSKPNETLFVDDSSENIKAAEQIGIKTILFESFESFLPQYKKHINI